MSDGNFKVPRGMKRSNEWPKVRKEFLKQNPECVVCGGKVKLEAHHIKPFHLFPKLELDPKNLIALCEANHNGSNCHLLFGHLGNFKSYNSKVRVDSKNWQTKIKNRPK